jgi:N-acetylglucosamine-6-phosphate deacetylase
MKIIDIHSHGIGGYDTRTTDVHHILKIAEIHGSHGVSEILLTIYPSSIKMMRKHMETAKRAMELQDARFKIQNTAQIPPSPPLLKGGKGGLQNRASEQKTQNIEPAKIIGLHLEGPFLNPSKCGALNKVSFIEPAEYKFRELIEGFESIVKIMTIAPEMNEAIRLIRKITDKGIIASMGHSDATYAEAEAGSMAGARGITHIFNAMRGFHHREPGIAGFGLSNQDVYIEVIADPYHLHSKTLELIFKTKDNKKIIIVSDTVKETKRGSGRREGVTGVSGKLFGGSMTITGSAKRLMKMGYNKADIMKCISVNPYMYLNIA